MRGRGPPRRERVRRDMRVRLGLHAADSAASGHASRGVGDLVWSPGSDFSLRGGARLESQASLSVKTRVSLTGRHPEFPPNPPIEDGDEQAFTVRCRIGPAQLPIRGGTHGEAAYERSGSPLQGEFEYGRLRGSIRNRTRLSPTQEFRVRLVAGSTVSGALPGQKVW